MRKPPPTDNPTDGIPYTPVSPDVPCMCFANTLAVISFILAVIVLCFGS